MKNIVFACVRACFMLENDLLLLKLWGAGFSLKYISKQFMCVVVLDNDWLVMKYNCNDNPCANISLKAAFG